MHPQPRVQMKKAHEHSHHGHTGNHPAFPAQWFYGLLRALPGDRACCHRHLALLLARLDASFGASEPHDFAVRISIIRPARFRAPDAAASTASRSAFVTCARPSVGRDGEGYRSDLGPLASEISEFQKFVERPSRRLPLQLDGILGNRLNCPGRAKSVHPVLRAKTI